MENVKNKKVCGIDADVAELSFNSNKMLTLSFFKCKNQFGQSRD